MILPKNITAKEFRHALLPTKNLKIHDIRRWLDRRGFKAVKPNPLEMDAGFTLEDYIRE